MDIWSKYLGKKIFLRTKYNRVYTGKVTDIDDKVMGCVFISLVDIKNKDVIISVADIVEIKEEL
jgi:small nuclear ribonucleoprotein (snRNP)-like protein